MKSVLYKIVIVIFILTIISSCKKYNCECTAYNINNPEGSGHTNFTVKGLKNKRKQLCNDKSTQQDSYGNYTTCVIK